jgi:hypothetical protein
MLFLRKKVQWDQAEDQLIETLGYKPGSRSLIPNAVIELLDRSNPSSRTRPWSRLSL